MSLSFYKYVGAGNDFVFLEYQTSLSKLDLGKLSRKICDRHYGIGADGLVVVETVSLIEKKFKWHFFNSDGSSAEMCGNAARCAFQFIRETHNIKTATMEALCGTLQGEALDEGGVSVSWEVSSPQLEKKALNVAGKIVDGFFINTGVPHFVLLNKENEVTPELCRLIQDHSEFGPHKTNVTLLEQKEGENRTRTFERGVCDFTLACGTGVIASAFVLQSIREDSHYNLKAPGGSLQVFIEGHQVTLIGPADLVYTGQFHLRRFHV